MDIRFLHSLITVIDSGSIAAAARKENLTAAAISQRIKTLENTFKCSLLTRTGHSAKPTEDCLRILPRLKKIAVQVSLIEHDLDTSALSGILKVGVISSVLSGLLPRCIKELTLHSPHLLLNIVPGTSQDLYKKLLNQEIDLAIVVNPTFSLPKTIENYSLFSEPLILISDGYYSDIESALKYPFIKYDKSSWGGAIAEQYITDNKLFTNTVCEIDSLESIVLMVKEKMGVSLIPKWEGLSILAPKLSQMSISDSQYQRQIVLLINRQSGKEKLLAAFKKTIQSSL